jgi:DNA-binding CsgD family transcriptional regulator
LAKAEGARVLREAGSSEDRFVAALYDDALFDGDYRRFLEVLRTSTNSIEANLPLKITTRGRQEVVFHSTGKVFSPSVSENYAKNFHGLDPKKGLFDTRGPGYLFNDIEHFDEGFVSKDSFYQEFSRPLDSRHTLDIMLSRSRGRESYLAVMRSRSMGAYEAETTTLFLRAADHVCRALHLKDRMDEVQSALTRANFALDRIRFGIVFVDDGGRVSFANAAAKTMCERDAGLRLSRGQLSARDNLLSHSLQTAIARVSSGAGRAPSVLRIPVAPDRSWIVSVMPAAHARTGNHGAILTIVDTADERLLRATDLMTLYGLTRAEAEIALALARGETLKSVAACRGVKLSTARTQLLAVLEKLNVHRQADLVRLLAALPGLA